MIRIAILVLIVFFYSCSQEDTPIPQFEDRETILRLDQETLGLQLWTEGDSTFMVLRSLGSDQLYSPTDTLLISNEIMPYAILELRTSYQGSIWKFLANGGNRKSLHVQVSGEVKKQYLQDSLPGPPLLISSIEIIPECPQTYVYQQSPALNLTSTGWNFKGFVDESLQIYSHPSCEQQLISLIFSGGSIESIGYMSYFERDLYALNFQGFPVWYYHGLNDSRGYKIKDGKIEIHGITKIRPLSYAQSNAGSTPFYSTVFTKNKADSLNLLFQTDTRLDFQLNGNTLILENPETKLRALFASN